MSTISKVSVNGVIYNLPGGSSGGESAMDVYWINGFDVFALANDADTQDKAAIENALGGSEKLLELFEAVHAGKIIAVKGTYGEVTVLQGFSTGNTDITVEYITARKANGIDIEPSIYSLYALKLTTTILTAHVNRYKLQRATE